MMTNSDDNPLTIEAARQRLAEAQAPRPVTAAVEGTGARNYENALRNTFGDDDLRDPSGYVPAVSVDDLNRALDDSWHSKYLCMKALYDGLTRQYAEMERLSKEWRERYQTLKEATTDKAR